MGRRGRRRKSILGIRWFVCECVLCSRERERPFNTSSLIDDDTHAKNMASALLLLPSFQAARSWQLATISRPRNAFSPAIISSTFPPDPSIYFFGRKRYVREKLDVFVAFFKKRGEDLRNRACERGNAFHFPVLSSS